MHCSNLGDEALHKAIEDYLNKKSGKPVVAQDTGAARHCPVGEGLLVFTTADEALSAVEEVAAEYPRHARAARALADRLAKAGFRTSIVVGFSTIGGGSAPGSALPTRLVAIALGGESTDSLEAKLRALDPPVVARIEDDRLVLDLRTVPPEEDEALGEALARLARPATGG